MYMVWSIHQNAELLSKHVQAWLLHKTLPTFMSFFAKWCYQRMGINCGLVGWLVFTLIAEGFSLDVCLINFNMHCFIQESWSWSKVYKGFPSNSNPAFAKVRKPGWHQFSLGNKLRHRGALHDFFLGTLGRRDWMLGDLIPPTSTWALQAFFFPVK